MEKVLKFNMKSALGSFKRPQSNNNHSTFYIPPKSTIIGLMGGVIGWDRKFMREHNMYKKLTENLKYSIKLKTPFKLKSWSEYGYNHGNLVQSNRAIYTPDKFERIYDIEYDTCFLYDDEKDTINNFMENFIKFLKNSEFVFPPYLGMRNFFVDVEYIDVFNPIKKTGEFNTSYICTNLNLNSEQPFSHIRTDDIPTLNVSYLSFDHKSYKTVFFHDNCGTLNAVGDYYSINDELIEFI